MKSGQKFISFVKSELLACHGFYHRTFGIAWLLLQNFWHAWLLSQNFWYAMGDIRGTGASCKKLVVNIGKQNFEASNWICRKREERWKCNRQRVESDNFSRRIHGVFWVRSKIL
ncbi:hypothetical protein CHS0354_038826 [Potamilus streckersoni]|uniref:Uncharacterized protein n=1 Tax=Potamilus streckersoni TaxID=2493646 RepID=A0AAE0THR5_9BIVA|nr:hypothetical protein CHS0354_038826 [Potamilus streckersoni]